VSNRYEKLIQKFENNQFGINYNNPKHEIAKNRLLATLQKDNNTGVSFLRGEIGVGKSFIAEQIKATTKHKIILINGFIESEKELLQIIYKELNSKNLANNMDIIKMRDRVNESLKREIHMLIVDNAHSLSMELLNRLAVLVSNEILNLLLVFDDDSGKHIFSNMTLGSYKKNIIKIENLTLTDTENFIRELFSDQNLKKELSELLKRNKRIYQFTQGNFSKLREFFYSLLKIVITAEKNQINKLQKISDCLLVMSALESKLIK
jgi:replication-associated recombination protein RarA